MNDEAPEARRSGEDAAVALAVLAGGSALLWWLHVRFYSAMHILNRRADAPGMGFPGARAAAEAGQVLCLAALVVMWYRYAPFRNRWGRGLAAAAAVCFYNLLLPTI